MIAAVGAFFTAAVKNEPSKFLVQLQPDSFGLPFGEAVVADSPRRHVLGHHPPRNAASHQVEDRVEYTSLVVTRGPTEFRGSRYQGFNYAPFAVGQVVDMLLFPSTSYSRKLFRKSANKVRENSKKIRVTTYWTVPKRP